MDSKLPVVLSPTLLFALALVGFVLKQISHDLAVLVDYSRQKSASMTEFYNIRFPEQTE